FRTGVGVHRDAPGHYVGIGVGIHRDICIRCQSTFNIIAKFIRHNLWRIAIPHINWINAVITAVVSFLAGLVVLVLSFGNPFSYNLIYTENAGQSPKVIAVWQTLEPVPPVT